VHVFRVLPNGGAAVVGRSGRRLFRTRRWAAAAALLLTLVGGAGLWLHLHERAAPEPEPPATVVTAGVQPPALNRYRIAVLPFANMSADTGNEYFSDGMTEELISKLSRLHDLSVIARTSIMHYKATEKGIAEIGRELQVGTILEGSVRKGSPFPQPITSVAERSQAKGAEKLGLCEIEPPPFAAGQSVTCHGAFLHGLV
jgi:hypothetical protein